MTLARRMGRLNEEFARLYIVRPQQGRGCDPGHEVGRSHSAAAALTADERKIVEAVLRDWVEPLVSCTKILVSFRGPRRAQRPNTESRDLSDVGTSGLRHRVALRRTPLAAPE